MHGLAACPADEQSGPEAVGREALEVLEDIRAAVRNILMLATQNPENPLLASASLRATEAGVAAENVAAREIPFEEAKADYYARGRADMAAEFAARHRLQAV